MIALAAGQAAFVIPPCPRANPACYVAYNILYCDGKELLYIPLIERRCILLSIATETPLFAISRAVETNGTALFAQAKAMGLAGVVAKKKTSIYYMGRNTKD